MWRPFIYGAAKTDLVDGRSDPERGRSCNSSICASLSPFSLLPFVYSVTRFLLTSVYRNLLFNIAIINTTNIINILVDAVILFTLKFALGQFASPSPSQELCYWTQSA